MDKIRKTHESIEAFMGKRVHEVLDWFFKEKIYKDSFITVDVLLNRYTKLWELKWHENVYLANLPKYISKKINLDKEVIYKEGLRCLVNYYNRYNPNFNKNVIGTEVECEVKIGEYSFKCIIDRIDKVSGDIYEIYDYKTGKKEITPYQAKNNFQLAIYQLAVQQNFTDCKGVVLNWYFLRTNNIISVEHNQNKIKELNNNIIKEIINIKYDKEFLPKESLLCEWCYNWEECSIKSTGNPAYKLH